MWLFCLLSATPAFFPSGDAVRLLRQIHRRVPFATGQRPAFAGRQAQAAANCGPRSSHIPDFYDHNSSED